MTNELKFAPSADASKVTWTCAGTALANREKADFWRIMADDGYYIEMQIKSSEQTGKSERDGNRTVVTYDRLVTDQGRILDIRLRLTVTDLGDRLVFDSEIDNRDENARVNELPALETRQSVRGIGELVGRNFESAQFVAPVVEFEASPDSLDASL